MRTSLRLTAVVAVMLSMVSLAFAQPCEVVDDGSGTVSLPPVGCGYLSPDDVHTIIAGLPAGTTLELAPEHAEFFNVQASPDTAGGEIETFDSILTLQITGTGDLAGFNRFIALQVQCQVRTGPRNNGDAVQTFSTEMLQLQGELFGDPDFDLLRITGGAIVAPSPGSTTLTRLGPPGSSFSVDSFFDIAYTVEFAGAPGSALDGFGGTTQGSLRMQTGSSNEHVPASQPWGMFVVAGLMVIVGGWVLRRRMAAIAA